MNTVKMISLRTTVFKFSYTPGSSIFNARYLLKLLCNALILNKLSSLPLTISGRVESIAETCLNALSKADTFIVAISTAVSFLLHKGKKYKDLKEEIIYDDFIKNDLRVATIIEAEKVEKADKLLKLTLDVGFETRTVVSGIALYFKPEEILGKKVTLLANLAPRKLKGIESKGMILMSENEDGSLQFVAAPEGAENGATIS